MSVDRPAAVLAEAHATLAQDGRSFALAGRLLPQSMRDDAAIVYAFCRLVDDAADEAPNRAEALIALDALQAELEGRVPRRPLVAAVCAVFARREVPEEAATELLRGVRGDLGDRAGALTVADDAELLRYAYRVAGTVGLMMCGVLGVRDREAWAGAIDLGVAMQLTNIARDVRADAALGRVYLPRTRLLAHGVTPEELLACTPEAAPSDVRLAVRAVVGELLALAERYYRSADAAMAAIPLRPRLAIAAAARIYRAIGPRLLRRHGGDALHGRTVVPTPARLFWLVAGVAFAMRAASARAQHAPALHQALRGLPGCDEGPATREARRLSA